MSAIFISHSSTDNVAASKLIDRLEEQGHHSVFLDFDPEQGIPAGTNWEQVLYAKLRACRAVIFLCSPHSMASKWCFAEITHARSLGKSLFPVVVETCELQSLFSDTQVIDLSDEINYQRLWDGLKKAGLEDVFDWDGKRDPYPGLNAFQEQDAALFFGRSEEIHKSIDLLRNIRRSGAERMLLFLGASGSGKSSLVRAGLIPRLKKDQDNWIVVDPFRSNELLGDPFFNLASVLSASFKRYNSIQEINDIQQHLLKQDQNSHPLLQQACSLAICSGKREASVLIFIDQFEEILGTNHHNSNNEQTFLEWLGEAINQAQKTPACPLIVVATIRSDFFVDLQRSSALQNVDYAEFSVKPIPKSGIVELIEGPARLVGLQLESGLAPQIIEDIETQNALPLLAFTLAELWKRYGQDGDLTMAEYQQLGGVRGSVKRASEDTFPEKKLSPQQERDLRRALLAMVQVGEANQYRRKTAALNELPEAALPMLEKLVETRLLVKGETGITYEVAHESLFEEWDLLNKWLTENREFLGWRRRFQTDLQKWEDLQQDEGTLLRGASLAEAEGWFKEHQADLIETEQTFFKASINLREKEEHDRLEQQQKILKAKDEKLHAEMKTARNFKRFTLVASVLLMFASLFARYAIDQQKKAEQQTLEANYNLAKVFEEKAIQQLKRGHSKNGKNINFQKAWLYATAALTQPIANESRALSVDSMKQLFQPDIIQQLFTQRWFSPSTKMRFASKSIRLSPDGKTLASGSDDKTIHLWDVTSGKHIKKFDGHTDTVNSVAFSPDGLTLVSAGDDTVRFWDVGSGMQIQRHVLDATWISSVAFSPDGKILASGSNDSAVRLWDVTNGNQIHQLKVLGGKVSSVNFSPDGQILAYGAANHVGLHDVTSGKKIRQLSGRIGTVRCVAFSPDGKTLVSGSHYGIMWLWDLSKGMKIHQFEGHSSTITSVAFSPDAKTLVSGAHDNTVRLWDVVSGRQIHQFEGHTDQVNSVDFSPDGKTLFSGSNDNTVRLWDVASHKQIQKIDEHNEEISSTDFSPDGKTLISGSMDKTLRLWDAASGKQIQKIDGHTDAVNSVAFSPDGKTLVSGSEDNTMRLWDVVTGKQIQQLEDHSSSVNSAVYSPDGKILVSGSNDNTILLWDTVNGKQMLQLNGHTDKVNSVAFSPDGKTVVSGAGSSTVHLDRDQTVHLWDVASGKQIKKFEGHSRRVNSVDFSPDGKTLVSGSNDSAIQLWYVASGKQIKKLDGHTDHVNSVEFSPDGKSLVSGSKDQTIRLWNIHNSMQIQQIDVHSASVHSVAFSPNGRTLVSGTDDNTLRLWDVVNKENTQLVGDVDSKILSIAFSSDRKNLVLGLDDGTVRLWDVTSGKQILQLEGHSNDVTSVAFSKDGGLIASGTQDETVRLWDATSEKQVQQLESHTGGVSSIVFSPDGKTLVSGSGDNTIHLWDVTSGKLIQKFDGHTSRIKSLAFNLDGNTLASGSYDNTIRLWNLVSGQMTQKLDGHSKMITSVAFSPDGKTLASGSVDQTICLWDVASGQLIHKLKGHTSSIRSVTFSPDGKSLVSGSGDDINRLYNILYSAEDEPSGSKEKENTVRLWDVVSGKQIYELEGYENEANTVIFSADGNTLILASISWIPNVSFWNMTAFNLFLNDGKATDILLNFSKAGEFLWQLELDGLEVKHKPRSPAIKSQDGYFFNYNRKFRLLLDPPKPDQTKFNQVLEWAIEQTDK